jgi:hypothetical protein
MTLRDIALSGRDNAAMNQDVNGAYEQLRSANLLWHYTTWVALEGVIRHNRIWASHIEYLNDSREYVHGVDLIKPLLERLGLNQEADTFSQRAVVDIYTSSFSKRFDSLSQWRAYAGVGIGIAIGFDRTALETMAKRYGTEVIECYYLKQGDFSEDTIAGLRDRLEHLKQLRDEAFRPKSPQESMGSKAGMRYGMALGSTVHSYLPSVAAMVKDYGFHEECESRLTVQKGLNREAELCFRVRGSLVVPYIEMELTAKGETDPTANPIRGILIGPSVHKELVKKAVHMLLESEAGELPIQVAISPLPFRSW